jgi:hypothetical protein
MERYAITGYVPDAVAGQLQGRHAGAVEVSPERGRQDVKMRVDLSAVTEVRTGSSAGGETLVQLLLQDGAQVETVITTTADPQGMKRFLDPALERLTAAATIKVIAA